MIDSTKALASVALWCLLAGCVENRSGGDCSPPSLDAFRPEALLALRLAFLVGRRQCGRPNVDVALLRGRGVRHLRSPTRSGERRVGEKGRARGLPDDYKKNR